jgi:hypothetical protein
LTSHFTNAKSEILFIDIFLSKGKQNPEGNTKHLRGEDQKQQFNQT